MNRLSCHRLSGFGFGFDVNKTEPWSDRPRGALYVRIWFLFWILAIDTGSEPYCKTKEESKAPAYEELEIKLEAAERSRDHWIERWQGAMRTENDLVHKLSALKSKMKEENQ
jgi:hypothetical protein